MPSVDHPEVAKALRQVAPRETGSVAVEHGLDEQPVVLGGYANMPSSAGEQIADVIPLIVS
ncbi:hypothetical protein GW15_0214985 [Xanthomonas axonopodis pv. vasculorum]|uniref:Uncharacterized protein n=1 Tax=Xanthomonas axonopodis pv. vasculorum TaxID=325777 RepID=A0A098PWA8_9XANT|nr:hypothetical protein GW15_0214985 [Xanthomonas axonopodis pv. vasculorum]